MSKVKCTVCSKEFAKGTVISAHGIRHEIQDLILNDHPEWSNSSFICKNDYEKYRVKYITTLITEERGQIEKLEAEVVKNISESEIISANSNVQYEKKYGIGDRISDKVAQFGGSWRFIISFFLVLLLWIVINSHVLLAKPFDPYPFILMNLILSCIAAIQAPIIMMSQNRIESKDRLKADNDYKVNLKAEIEIRTLHEKMDHLLLEQWSKMMEIQELQIDLLNEIRETAEKRNMRKPNG
jgi:uncharacterized membrane protein